MLNENVVARINSLSVSDGVRKDIQGFVSQIIEFYTGDLLSVMLFGSVMTGDYGLQMLLSDAEDVLLGGDYGNFMRFCQSARSSNA